MYLLDTNIFLEILLKQERSEYCKKFLHANYDKIFISDFSLHSIAVILFRHKKQKIFEDFLNDVLTKIRILNLPATEYLSMMKSSKENDLDFDDLYQYVVAKYYDMQIVTMDSDFKKILDLKIVFF